MTEKLPQFYYKQNRLKQLKAFCAAAKCGSVSLAAESLFLSQPTVTLQIQALEREMDVTLFERRGPKITLTPEGVVLNQIAQPLVDGIEGLEESFHAHFGKLETGELNIAAGESTTLYILPKYIKRFSEAYPGIQIKLHNVTGRDGMTMLRADEADLAIGSMLEVPDDIIYRQSLSFSHTLITPLDHPLANKENITLEDICPYGLILPPRHLATWRFLEWVFSQSGLKFSVSLEAGGWEIIKKYVALGMGVSIVTDVCLTGEEALARKSLDKFIPKRSYGVVVRKGKFLNPQSQAFIDMIDADFFKQMEETSNLTK
ncbi:MAG: LysR family transcriptional regulator [Gammaproteobacteria bacterium]|jgi:DNA-binding transcriptional LysR family regulator|nr:LysR family transcriptional regulator [Gammaproteobacteria bacterium]MBT3724210.1 LysR family transcriptional regulator [Gammaproteobacteria bacterium]MBT4193115.1 LysR family transcriptional regulator [Gammaproteobacteria bacterium]MBT4450250.1 LysR family transcriptional regulator [Gammaproteobacteria bacterium]MBT4860814.1 LysR family transcriptional regulator [Gammaproteobacteria bacterium]